MQALFGATVEVCTNNLYCGYKDEYTRIPVLNALAQMQKMGLSVPHPVHYRMKGLAKGDWGQAVPFAYFGWLARNEITEYREEIVCAKLLADLDNQDPIIRAAALAGICCLKSTPEIRSKIINATHDPSPLVRRYANQACFSTLGKDETPYATIRSALIDVDPEVNCVALEAAYDDSELMLAIQPEIRMLIEKNHPKLTQHCLDLMIPKDNSDSKYLGLLESNLERNAVTYARFINAGILNWDGIGKAVRSFDHHLFHAVLAELKKQPLLERMRAEFHLLQPHFAYRLTFIDQDRNQILKLLGEIGPAAAPLRNEIAKVLNSHDERDRVAAAEALKKISAGQ